MYDKIETIQFEEMSEIKEFVDAASRCDFEIDIKCNRQFIDAKSILGVIGIGLKNRMQVCYGGNNSDFQNIVDKLSIA